MTARSMDPRPEPTGQKPKLNRSTPLKRNTPLKANTDRTREWVNRSQQATVRARKPRPVSPASKEQRAKLAGRSCIVTGDREGLTPAHLVDRSLGGCDSPLCVVPLRVDAHRSYDDHALDLLPYLEAHGLREEIAHAVGHLGLLGALERLTGVSWRPVELPERAA